MAMYKVVPCDAARLCSVFSFTKPVPLNKRKFSRSAIAQHENGSYKSPSYDFTNPLVREGEVSLKLRFVDQAKHMMYEVKDFYQDFIGNKEVQESQSKVNDLQHKISVLIEKRSSCEFELIEVKKQLAELNSSQQAVAREDTQYIDLLKNEFKIYSEKQRLDSLIEVINYEHQMTLMQLTHAFNDVHVKERQEANNIRLVKLFLTAIVAVLGFGANAGYNHYKDSKVQNHMTAQTKMMKTLVDYVEQEQSRNVKPSTESWSSYLYRQPGRLYGYMFPKQSNESWGSSLSAARAFVSIHVSQRFVMQHFA